MKKCAKTITLSGLELLCVRRRGHKGLHKASLSWGTISISLKARRNNAR